MPCDSSFCGSPNPLLTVQPNYKGLRRKASLHLATHLVCGQLTVWLENLCFVLKKLYSFPRFLLFFFLSLIRLLNQVTALEFGDLLMIFSLSSSSPPALDSCAKKEKRKGGGVRTCVELMLQSPLSSLYASHTVSQTKR